MTQPNPFLRQRFAPTVGDREREKRSFISQQPVRSLPSLPTLVEEWKGERPKDIVEEHRRRARKLRDLGYRDTKGNLINEENYINHEVAEWGLVNKLKINPKRVHDIVSRFYPGMRSIQEEYQAVKTKPSPVPPRSTQELMESVGRVQRQRQPLEGEPVADVLRRQGPGPLADVPKSAFEKFQKGIRSGIGAIPPISYIKPAKKLLPRMGSQIAEEYKPIEEASVIGSKLFTRGALGIAAKNLGPILPGKWGEFEPGRLWDERKEFREISGKDPFRSRQGFLEFLEYGESKQPKLPWGVRGAVEAIPWLVSPTGKVTMVKMGIQAAKMGTLAATKKGPIKLAYLAAQKALQVGSEGARPVAEVEDAVAKAFGFAGRQSLLGLRKTYPGVERILAGERGGAKFPGRKKVPDEDVIEDVSPITAAPAAPVVGETPAIIAAKPPVLPVVGETPSIIGKKPPVAPTVGDIGQGVRQPFGAGGGKLPPTTTTTTPPTPGGPDETLARVLRQRIPGEEDEPALTLLRRHISEIRSAENEAGIAVRHGSQSLREKGIGQFHHGRLVLRERDLPIMDDLNNSLHNPSRVASGEVKIPRGFEEDYSIIRGRTDVEEAARIDFDPERATVNDYFYRGWLRPKGMPASGAPGRVGTRPAFDMPRVDASYEEMRELGFEPLFLNPYEQERFSRMMGVKTRQQTQLIEDLKNLNLAVHDASGMSIPGWRTPRIGPAFEGKPYVALASDGTEIRGFRGRYVVEDKLATRLENMYGIPPSLGNIYVGSRKIDIMKAVDAVVFLPKRSKLFGSIFQQRDFLQRSLAGTFSGMVDDLLAGKPISAIKKPILWPREAYKIIEANVSPSARLRIRETLNSTEPILKDRPGVHFLGIMKAGLSNIDPTMLPSGIDKLPRIIAEENGLMKVKAVARAVSQLESAMRRALFEGTYPAAQISTIKNFVAPAMARKWPNATDEALNGMIAEAANFLYSTIPAEQSVFQNRAVRAFLTRYFFSIGENEALLRQVTKGIRGPHASFWRTHWLGSYLAVLAVANTIHFATTGEVLPWKRFVPLSKDFHTLNPLGYRQDFAAPDIPIKGRGGADLTLDIVGQMDTAFRILDPISFLTARESVPMRAGRTQITGKTFFGEPVGKVGPGGVVSRVTQLIDDLFTPIGFGQSARNILQAKVPAIGRVLPEAEGRVGAIGEVLQGTGGINVRAEGTRQFLGSALEDIGLKMPDGSPMKEWDDAEPFIKDISMEAPRVKKEMSRRLATGVRRGGEFAIYGLQMDNIQEQRLTELNEVISKGKPDYFYIKAIEAKYRGMRIQAGLEMEFDPRDLNDPDPNKRAYSEYLSIYDMPGVKEVYEDEEGNVVFEEINWDKFEEEEAKLRRTWGSKQQDYILRNTNRRPTPMDIVANLPRALKSEIRASQNARELYLKAQGRPDLAALSNQLFYYPKTESRLRGEVQDTSKEPVKQRSLFQQANILRY